MPVARNSPLRSGAIAFGQQADIWLANARPNLPTANFTYFRNVCPKSPQAIVENANMLNNKKKL